MFRHSGKGRTYAHNLKLASILSCVAGVVNITGVLQVKVLTTNVTGHFAYFSEELSLRQYGLAFSFLVYTLFFLLGAFISSLLMEVGSGRQSHTTYVLPVSFEIILFLGLSLWSWSSFEPLPALVVASTLLFAMGLQNALVTRISHSVVRTTHLTGLFTDLGIELAQIFQKANVKSGLRKNILLKLSIITGFFVGCLVGGYTYSLLGLSTLLLPAGMLLYTLVYDHLRLRYLKRSREKVRI
jgi:uncharacterized membrane protein YoaK (UPF0700 family)